jgi:hypothetical protein
MNRNKKPNIFPEVFCLREEQSGSIQPSTKLRDFLFGGNMKLKEWSLIVKRRDKFICQKCKKKTKGFNCCAHHIKSKKEFPELIFDINNGMTLCRSCHVAFHDQEKHPMKGKSHTKESKKRMSISRTGKGNSMYGKHHSENTKRKQSEAKKNFIPWNKGLTKETDERVKKYSVGHPVSQESRKKMSEAAKGRIPSEKTRQLWSEQRKGRIPWNKGIKWSLKHKQKETTKMSHIQTIEVNITDLVTLKSACKRLGIEFMQDQKTFRWYQGASECAHAIKVPGANYEIGVLKNGDRKGFTLQVDYYDRKVTEKIGQLGGLFKQAYTLEKAKAEAIKKGYMVKEHRINDQQIELRIAIGG